MSAPGHSAQASPGQTGRHGRRRAESRRGLWITLGVLALAGGLYLLIGPALPAHIWRPEVLWRRLGAPLLRTLAYLAGGLLVGQLIEGLGWTRRLGAVAWPLIRRAHLPKEAGAAFSAAFASGVAANTLLYTSWQEGRFNRRQLVLANLLNASLPAFFLHLPTTLFVVYALMGDVALIYFGLTLLAAWLRCCGVVALSRLILPAAAPLDGQVPARVRPWRAVWAETWPKFLTRLRRMLTIILPVYLAVFLLAQGGFFTWLSHEMALLVSSSVLPLEAMSVVVFAVVAEFTSGFAAAGALLQAGSLGVREIVIALLIGNIVATPVRALRHQLPHYMGIYSPGLGAKLLLLGQGVRVLSVALVTLLYAWWS